MLDQTLSQIGRTILKGSRPGGGGPSTAAGSKFSYSPPSSNKTPFFKRDPYSDALTSGLEKEVGGCEKGTFSVEMGPDPYRDLFAIKVAGLSPEQTIAAQLLWSVRAFVQAQGALPEKPFQEWTIEDIIRIARGPR